MRFVVLIIMQRYIIFLRPPSFSHEKNTRFYTVFPTFLTRLSWHSHNTLVTFPREALVAFPQHPRRWSWLGGRDEERIVHRQRKQRERPLVWSLQADRTKRSIRSGETPYQVNGLNIQLVAGQMWADISADIPNAAGFAIQQHWGSGFVIPSLALQMLIFGIVGLQIRLSGSCLPSCAFYFLIAHCLEQPAIWWPKKVRQLLVISKKNCTFAPSS